MPNVVTLMPSVPSGPSGTTRNEIADLGASLGKQALTASVASRYGTSPKGRRAFDALASDAGEEVAEQLNAISARIGPKAAECLVRTLRTGMVAELARQIAFSAEIDADESAARHANK